MCKNTKKVAKNQAKNTKYTKNFILTMRTLGFRGICTYLHSHCAYTDSHAKIYLYKKKKHLTGPLLSTDLKIKTVTEVP